LELVQMRFGSNWTPKWRVASALRGMSLFVAGWAIALGAQAAAQLQITSFLDIPDPVAAGGVYDYTVRVQNDGTEAAINTRLRLNVPIGATFIPGNPSSTFCAPLLGNPSTVECNIGSLGLGVGDARDVVLRWRAIGPGPTTITATATVQADNDPNPGANSTQTVVTSVAQGANLALNMSAAPSPVIAGAVLSYVLTVTNAGPNVSGGLSLVDNLPPGVTFISATGSGWTCSEVAGTVSCTHPDPIGVSGAAPPVTISGRVTASGGVVTNGASVSPTVSGGVADPESADNTSTLDVSVLPGADLQMAAKFIQTPIPLIAGTNITFLLQPRNLGPGIASLVTVTDALPAGWTFVQASGPGWACGNASNTVICTRSTMPVGATDDITVIARAPSSAVVGATGTTFVNSASMTSGSVDPVSGNNLAFVNANVLPGGADLRLTKFKTPERISQGSNLTSTIDVLNNGPLAATGPLRVIESLSGESFVSASGSGWVCSVAGNIITCDHPNASGLAVASGLPSLVITTLATAGGAGTGLNAINTACTGTSVPTGVPSTEARPPNENDPNANNDCVTARSISTTGSVDLSVTKVTSTPTGDDKILSASEEFVTYTVVATNLPSSTAAGTAVRVEDWIPAWIQGRSSIQLPVGLTVTAGSTATFECYHSAFYGHVICIQQSGALAPGEQVTMTIRAYRPLRDGNFENETRVVNWTEGDPDQTNNIARDVVTIAPIADVEMAGKTVTPATVKAGETASYVLSFVNNGPSVATAVRVTDVFSFPSGDAGLTVLGISSSKQGSTCTIAAGSVLLPAASSYSCNIGDMANGEAQSITLQVRPIWQADNAIRAISNTATISTTSVESTSGGDNGNNSRTATLTVQPALVDLLINKTDRVAAVNLDPVLFEAGRAFLHYQISVANIGPSFATGVRVTETMVPPPGKRIRFVCDVTGFGSSTCNPTPLCAVSNVTSAPGVALPAFTCTPPAGTAITGVGVGELAVGASKLIYLRYEALDGPAPEGDIFSNTARISSNENDTQAANDVITETTTTRQRVEIRVTKAADVTSLSLQQPFNWTIRVTNTGQGAVLQTNLTDTLPAGVEITGPITWTRSLQPGSGTCSLAGLTITCLMGQLDSGGAASVTVPARLIAFPAGGSILNTATVDNTPAVIGGIDSPGGQNTATNTLPVTQSSLSGLVFLDRDRSGSNGGVPQSALAEPRVAGVSIRLTGLDAFGNGVDRTATTDAAGVYSFTGLSPSNAAGYTITETQPAGHANGPVAPPTSGPNAPTSGGVYAAGGGSGNSTYASIVLPTGIDGVNYNFPELRQPTLSGFVYLDRNNNGQRDVGTDPAIAGATVRLLNANTLAVIATTTTDALGAYTFIGLDSTIVYTLEQPLPAAPSGLINGAINAGLVDGAACATGCTAQPNTPAADTDRIASINLAAGGDGTGFNFGERQNSTLSGTVYLDRNRNGTLDATPTDGRLAGVTLRLVQGTDCAAGTLVATTTTDAQGNYFFPGLIPGATFTVCQVQPGGYAEGSITAGTNGASNAANAITVTNMPATGSVGNHFGERASSVAGLVFLDANADGARNTGENGLAGVVITLTGIDATGAAVTRTTVTDGAGAWRFDDVLAAGPAGYTVTEQAAQPVLGAVTTLNGRTTAGTVATVTSGTATSVATLPSAVSGIALAAGADSVNNLFAEILPVSISGTVFSDRNDNGVQNLPADNGIGGITIVITGVDDTGAAVSRTLTTAADGTYAALDLRPGTYTVTEPNQPPTTENGRTVAGSAGGTATLETVLPSAISNIVLTTPGAASTGNNFAELSDFPELFVSKAVVSAPWTVGRPGTYRITVRNAGDGNSNNVYTVRDRLPAGLTLVDVPTGTGWTCVNAVGGSSFTCTSSAVIAGGTTSANVITAVVNVGAAAVGGGASATVNNAVIVQGGGELPGRQPTAGERDAFDNNVPALPACSAAVDQNACRAPVLVQLPASISGTVWFDTGTSTRLLDAADRRLPGWIIEVMDGAPGASTTPVATARSGSDGSYSINNLTAATPFNVRFRDPASSVVFGYPVNGETAPGSSGASCVTNAATAGTASSCVGSGANPSLSVVLAAGQNLPQQSLPVDPTGVVYDSVTRQPVPGSVVALEPVGTCTAWNASNQVVAATLGGYRVAGNSIAMTVGPEGFYQFLLAPSAPASCTYALTVTPPRGYTGPSQIIPVTAGPLVPTGGAGSTFRVQPQADAPAQVIGVSTTYYLTLTTGSQGANVVHNHIPLDPAITSVVALTKSGDRAAVEIGDSVRYTLTVSLLSGSRPVQTTLVDRLPPGFTYIRGTATLNNLPLADPTGGQGPTLVFNLGAMPAGNSHVLRYRVRVGVGAAQGDGVNRARAHACPVLTGCVGVGPSYLPNPGSVPTNEAAHRVRVQGGVFGSDACVLGKIFVDCNGNHVQDREELGIPGVRLLLSDGTTLTSDSEGKYSVCGITPRSHVLKVDPITLPRGSRLTTSSNRNLGDAGSLWLDLKRGELHRGDFIEGSCSNTVIEQVKARRAQGEVRAPESEKRGTPGLRFDSKAHGRSGADSPQQGTDGANQRVPKPRTPASAPRGVAEDESHVPTSILPINGPPSPGRSSGATDGGSNAGR
jgi:large repetitive protein